METKRKYQKTLPEHVRVTVNLSPKHRDKLIARAHKERRSLAVEGGLLLAASLDSPKLK